MGKVQRACKAGNLGIYYEYLEGKNMNHKSLRRVMAGILGLALAVISFLPPWTTAFASPMAYHANKPQPSAKFLTKPKFNEAAPMSFVVVRLNLASCEPNCPQWIAAEGRIENSTPVALAKLLTNPEYRKLPVILNSGGGKIFAAMETGRLIRKFGMTTSVGYTSFVKCNPFKTKDGTCKPSADTKAYSAYAFANRGYCFSACPLILLGGVTRIIDKNAEVGLHEPVDERRPYIDHFWVAWHMVHGQKVIVSRRLLNRTYLKAVTMVGVTPDLKQKLLPYFKQMGGSPALIDEMSKATPDKINVIAQHGGAREKLGLATGLDLSLLLLTTAEHCKYKGWLKSNCVYVKQRSPHVFQPFERL